MKNVNMWNYKLIKVVNDLEIRERTESDKKYNPCEIEQNYLVLNINGEILIDNVTLDQANDFILNNI